MTSSDQAFLEWKRRAGEAAVDEVAVRLGLTLKRAGRELVGPCKACGGTDRFSINPARGLYNCRGAGGGDVIAMVMHCEGLDFIAACEIITGDPPPKGDSHVPPPDPAEEARRAAEREAADAARHRTEDAFRQAERTRTYQIWHHAQRLPGTAAEAYLCRRLGIGEDALPAVLAALRALRLRCVPDMPYYRHGADRGEVLARAPVLLAPIVDAAGIFRGLHFTYLDLSQPKGKLVVADADGTPLPAKKVRGSQAAHRIELFTPPARPLVSLPPCGGGAGRGVATPAAPAATPLPIPPPQGGREQDADRHGAITRLIIGEGIEKTLAVWRAHLELGRDLASTAFWCAINLGNLGGKAAASVRHPTAVHEKSGRPLKVAGPVPDLAAPAIAIPDSVTDLALLGDSTSDDFATRCTLARASARYAREGRSVRVAWAPPGMDFDDMLRAA